MRRLAAPRFRQTLELARNVVNITFPEEFGVPALTYSGSTILASFPPSVMIRPREYPGFMAVGEGADEASALIDLFSFYGDLDAYRDVLVSVPRLSGSQAFIPCLSPFQTVMFRKEVCPLSRGEDLLI